MKENAMKEKFKVPAFTVAALSGGSGKTIVSLGLARAYSQMGKNICCFKKGPDYIDAAWLACAASRPCYNLDPFLMDEETLRDSFNLRAQNADVAIIEGNRGLFDGMDVSGTSSTSKLCTSLGVPVLLVVDCTKSTRTVAAMVLGCLKFEQGLDFLGVILNRVGSQRHVRVVTEAVETYTGLPVLGFIPRLKKDPLPMRHLGLTPADEFTGHSETLDALARIVEENVDVEKVLALSAKRSVNRSVNRDIMALFGVRDTPFNGMKIGVVKDAAFQFYYPENLEAMELLGAELIFLNALSDRAIPPVHGMYIGGGFPETQANHLEKNHTFRKELLKLIENGLPVYAECGGLMYLGQKILWKNRKFNMVRALPLEFEMKRKPAGHGYTTLEFFTDSPFYKKGARIKGHEFHYSLPSLCAHPQADHKFVCKVIRGRGFPEGQEGFVMRNTFSTYTHIHALGQKEWARTFLEGVSRISKDHK